MSQQEQAAFYEEQSFIVSLSSPGSLISYNIEHGFFEAVIRGYRSGFLTTNNYRQLCQCETLDDLKLSLTDTDYNGVFSGVSRLTPDIIVTSCITKYVEEWNYIRNQAVGSLATVLDFISYEYMINNISFLIISLIKGGNPETLLAKCHPLGKFPYMSSILTFENSEDGLLDLYKTFLIDTPVAKYFELYFLSVLAEGHHEGMEHIHQIFREEQIEVINDMLKKFWLEDFYAYCLALGGENGAVMGELLDFEADKRAILIMVNSFGTALNDPSRRDERQKLFASCGKLYPEAINKFQDIGDMAGLSEALSKYPYSDLFERAERDQVPIEHLLLEKEVAVNRYGFDGQSHVGCFYSFIKLKEQERRNLYWISECIQQQMLDNDHINRWVPIFGQI